MLRQAALSWWQCASRSLCHHANAACRSTQLSSTLGCKSSTNARPLPPNAKSMRPSCSADVTPQCNCSQFGCSARPASSTSFSSALPSLRTHQSTSTNTEAWPVGVAPSNGVVGHEPEILRASQHAVMATALQSRLQNLMACQSPCLSSSLGGRSASVGQSARSPISWCSK